MTARIGVRAAFAIAVFAVLAAAILSRPEKRLTDFDQSFYLTIAHDLAHWGVFSNGIFDEVNSSESRPPAGMFFTPVYPALVWLAMQADPRFKRAVECHVRANNEKRDLTGCEFYARPIHLLHAALLTAAVIAIALTAEAIFGGGAIFFLAGLIATIGLAVEADLFSFVMTESTGIALFSLAALPFVLALKSARGGPAAGAGLLLGLLVLARPSFQAMAPLWLAGLVAAPWLLDRRPRGRQIVAFVLGIAIVIGPWLARNAIAIGKTGLSEEYGAATLIERLAFNDMTAREFALAFPYCVPVIGPIAVKELAGADATARFDYASPNSFFATGRARREALVKDHGRLDPVIGGILRDEMARHGIAHVLTTVPMAWCGLWVSQLWSVVFLPLFALALLVAVRRRIWLFVIYVTPALGMVVVHAAAANHYPRYNLMLIGPISVGAAWIIPRLAALIRSRQRQQPS